MKARVKIADCLYCRRPIFEGEDTAYIEQDALHAGCLSLHRVSVYDRPLALVVADALASVATAPQDDGAVALAYRYAALIDNAQPEARYHDHLTGVAFAIERLGALGEVFEASEARKHFRKLSDALSAHSVASDLGPKLLATLTALGMTSAGRGVKGGAASAGVVKGTIDNLRERRLKRAGQHRAANMDTPAT